MTALLLIALAQSPDVPVAIVISSRRDTSKAAPALCEQVKVALSAQGFHAMSDAESIKRLSELGGVEPKACDGARLCLQKLAQLLHGVVIGVDVSRAGKLTAGHIEAVAMDRVDSLATIDVASDAKSWVQKSGEAAKSLADKLKPPLTAMREALQPKEPPRPPEPELKPPPPLAEDQPKQVTLTPAPPPTPPPAVAVEKRGPGPVPYILTGAAILSAGASVLFFILGLQQQNEYRGSFVSVPGYSGQGSSFTDAKLSSLASSSNLKMGLGVGFIGAAVALGVTSAVLFLKD
jgi:hypothetical protein